MSDRVSINSQPESLQYANLDGHAIEFEIDWDYYRDHWTPEETCWESITADFPRVLIDLHPSVDQNEDGSISRQEIEDARVRRGEEKFTLKERQALQELESLFDLAESRTTTTFSEVVTAVDPIGITRLLGFEPGITVEDLRNLEPAFHLHERLKNRRSLHEIVFDEYFLDGSKIDKTLNGLCRIEDWQKEPWVRKAK